MELELSGYMKKLDSKGYVRIYYEDKWIQEHRLVAELILERKLTQEECVHHKDLVKTNNSPENLILFSNQKEHSKFHIKLIKFPCKTHPMLREEKERSILNITKHL